MLSNWHIMQPRTQAHFTDVKHHHYVSEMSLGTRLYIMLFSADDIHRKILPIGPDQLNFPFLRTLSQKLNLGGNKNSKNMLFSSMLGTLTICMNYIFRGVH